jgi:hypothetical protein
VHLRQPASRRSPGASACSRAAPATTSGSSNAPGWSRSCRPARSAACRSGLYARTVGRIELADPAAGQPNIVFRHALADLESAPTGSPRTVFLRNVRVDAEAFAEFAARLDALAEELAARGNPAAPPGALAVAFFRPDNTPDPGSTTDERM